MAKPILHQLTVKPDKTYPNRKSENIFKTMETLLQYKAKITSINVTSEGFYIATTDTAFLPELVEALRRDADVSGSF